LGGVAQVFPRDFDGWSFAAGWSGFGDESYQHAGWGDGETGWSVGFARRSADNDVGADGGELNSHFTQSSATLRKRWQRRGRSFELLAIPTLGRDIGKPNTDYPERVTDYPRERHLLLKFATTGPRGGSLQAFVHPNDLETEVLLVGESLNVVGNESTELGVSWQRPWTLNGEAGPSDPHGSWGVDYFARRGVDADERVESLADGTVSLAHTLDGAAQDEVAAFGTARWSWGAATFQAGTRFTWQRQANGADPSRDDTAWTAFAGLVRPLGGGFELTANLGSGLRFPNLSERFFTGTTGRGQVIGNPDLEPESSLNVDLGVRRYGSKAFWSAQVFHLRIADYIERIDSADDTRTFVNLTSGTIRGLEVEGFYQLDDWWRLSWSGHFLDGEASDGSPLADVSSDRLQATVEYDRGDWQGRLQLQHRAAKDDPGSGELPLPSADLLSASLRYRITTALALTVRGQNLLDEEYRSSADDKTSIAAGRSVGVGLTWSAP
jgi:iron complex outermembrane receptor protein